MIATVVPEEASTGGQFLSLPSEGSQQDHLLNHMLRRLPTSILDVLLRECISVAPVHAEHRSLREIVQLQLHMIQTCDVACAEDLANKSETEVFEDGAVGSVTPLPPLPGWMI